MRSHLFRAMVVLALSASTHGLLAQSYSIKSYTIGGGGGASSTANGYVLKGTIGQPDAGQQSGGLYLVSGGFWSIAAVVPSDDSPTLRIVPSGRSVILAWPNSFTGFQLQQSPSLTAPVWSDVRSAPQVVKTENQVAIPLQPGSQFFRLRRDETR